MQDLPNHWFGLEKKKIINNYFECSAHEENLLIYKTSLYALPPNQITKYSNINH